MDRESREERVEKISHGIGPVENRLRRDRELKESIHKT